MKTYYLLPTLLVTGCAATTPSALNQSPEPLPQKSVTLDPANVRTPEQITAYPVGRYADPNESDLLHEAHTIYRVENSPAWQTDPSDDLLPGEVPPPTHHVVLTAELEEKLRQEDELLTTTYAQNERLAQELQALQDEAPKLRALLPDLAPSQPLPPTVSPAATPPVKPPAAPNPSTPIPTPTRTWSQWFRSFTPTQTQPSKNR